MDPAPVTDEITRILAEIERGDGGATDRLFPLVYQELRRLAKARMASEPAGMTLQPTALVHEVYLRLAGETGAAWQGRAHFFAAAAEAMRRILIDHARRRRAVRHGGGLERVPIEDLSIAAPGDDDELLAIHEALEKLARHDAQKAELVKLKYFAGLTTEESAHVLGLSGPTAKRYWAYARAWLFREIRRGA